MNKILLIKIIAMILLAALLIFAVTLFGSSENSGHKQTFFYQFVVAGGVIVWFILLPMSLVAAYFFADYFFTINRKKLLPSQSDDTFDVTENFSPSQLQSRLADKDDLVSIALKKALTNGRGDWYRMQSSLFESLEEQTLRLLRKIEWVNLIGNVSPMVGLFGTVVGMIQLFNSIVIAGGQPQTAKLAGGIAIALVTTFWGLLIAIPSLAIHGVFRNKIESIVSDATSQAEKVLSDIRIILEKQKFAMQLREKQLNNQSIKPVTINKPASAG